MSQDSLDPPARTHVGIRSVGFIVVVGAVLATFVYLGKQGRPPSMPATAPHKLQFNLRGELIGVFGEPGIAEAKTSPVELDKRATEGRVNAGCVACHGGPGQDPRTHACGAGRCLPPHHPPKSECIKCHRMPPSSSSSSSSSSAAAAATSP
jgi:hypothetical protein